MNEPTAVKEVLDSVNLPEPPQEPEVKNNGGEKKNRKSETAGKYVVLVRNDAAQTWWGFHGIFDIKDGDPRKQALEKSEELTTAAEEGEGVTLHAIPLSSWNAKTFKYERTLRESDVD